MLQFNLEKNSIALEGISLTNNALETLKNVSQRAQKQFWFAQIIPIRVFFSKDQIQFSFSNCVQAFEEKTNSVHTPALEFLMHFSGQNQLNEAFKKAGVKENESSALLIVAEKPAHGKKSSEKSFAKKFNQFLTDLEKNKILKIEKWNEAKLKSISKNNFNSVQKLYGISRLELKTCMDLGSKEKALNELVLEKMALKAL